MVGEPDEWTDEIDGDGESLADGLLWGLVARGLLRELSAEQLRLLLVLAHREAQYRPAVTWARLAAESGLSSWRVARSAALALWILGLINLPPDEYTPANAWEEKGRLKMRISDPQEWTRE
jgi:hypothetical protein